MSWSYTGDPRSSPKDEVRFLVGDTNSNKQLLQDEEVNYNILYVSPIPPSNGNFLAAAYCADAIAAKYAFLVDKAVGDLHISYSQLQKGFLALATKLRARATLLGVRTYTGGESIAEKQTNRQDTDLVQPGVKIDGMNYADPFDPNDPTGVP